MVLAQRWINLNLVELIESRDECLLQAHGVWVQTLLGRIGSQEGEGDNGVVALASMFKL